MSLNQITQLTPEQEALIPVFREKWRKIGLSTEPIDIEKAASALNTAYRFCGFPEPEIILCDSPYAAAAEAEMQLVGKVYIQIFRQILAPVGTQISQQVYHRLTTRIWDELETSLVHIHSRITNDLSGRFISWIAPDFLCCEAYVYDFCISVLNCRVPETEWQIFQAIASHCGWVAPYEKVTIISDRAIKISLDNHNHLYSHGESPLQFADGYCLYGYRQ
jgi:hypothetical protein